jgi:hypothetical protein
MSWKGFDSSWLQAHENRTRTQLPNPAPRERPAPLASSCGGEAPSTICPIVRFTLRRVRLLDVDAKYASVKDLLDGLQYAGLIHGDKEGQVRLEVVQEKVRKFTEESTLIEIEYAEPQTHPE